MESTLLNTSRDRSAPGVRLTWLPDEHAIEGQPLDLADRIIAFTFEDSDRKADKVTLQLDNADLTLFEREELVGGAVLETSWGYPGVMAPPRRVVLQKLRGFTSLSLEGRATSVLMNREKQTRAWEKQTRAQVARTVAAEHGYLDRLVDIEETDEALDVINQTSETDAHLLRRLAAREGFEFYIDDTGLHFHTRRQRNAPTRVLTWFPSEGQGDVLSVSVEGDLSRRAGRVTVKGRDPMTRATVEHTSNNQSAPRETLAEVIEVVDPDTGTTALETRNATSSVHASPITTQAQAQREADARFRVAERAAVRLTLRVVGDPTLRAKSIVEVRGLSSLLSGKHYVNAVKHLISAGGYTCELKLSRDGFSRAARQEAQEQAGERNQASPQQEDQGEGVMREVEIVDPDTGATHIEYRRG